MGWSIRLFDVAGTAVRIHLTFFLLLAWIAAIHCNRGGAAAAVDGVVFIVLLFVCVLLHEFGHVFAARRYGIGTSDVTLLPIGGLASLERMPEKPGQEIFVALAGPAVNLVIALVLVVVLGARFDLTQMAQLQEATIHADGPGRGGQRGAVRVQPDPGLSRWTAGACCGRCSPFPWATRAPRGWPPPSARGWRSCSRCSACWATRC